MTSGAELPAFYITPAIERLVALSPTPVMELDQWHLIWMSAVRRHLHIVQFKAAGRRSGCHHPAVAQLVPNLKQLLDRLISDCCPLHACMTTPTIFKEIGQRWGSILPTSPHRPVAVVYVTVALVSWFVNWKKL